MTIDAQLLTGLTRMKAALDALEFVEARALDSLTPAEARLEAQWTEALGPVLDDLYWYPLRNGINEAPTDERSLRRWLREKLTTAAAVAALLALLRRFLVRGANVGGQMGLDLLRLSGQFDLANAGYIARLHARADDLTTTGGDVSLIDTTVDDLVRGIPQARESEGDTSVVLGALIAGWVLTRSRNIAATELSGTVGNGLSWLYTENGISTMAFRTRGDNRVCVLCAPLEGRTMPTNNIPADLIVPRHTLCRCYYEAITRGWIRPPQIWRGA